jgi:SAM-dependent methyltransferase
MSQAVIEKQRSAEENLVLVQSPDQVDQINSAFYSRFPYPWRPQMFQFCTDRGLHTKLVNQNLGDWQHRTIPAHPRIWVAGCGTNQAVYTALAFPDAEIIGSVLSPKSLELCTRTADELKLRNLTLRQESINGVEYSECFDLVICTGVIHHNAEPERALKQLARAMKPSGVLELMVYNRFHRLLCSAFQKAVRIMASDKAGVLRSEEELKIARTIMRKFSVKNLIYNLLQRYRTSSESEFADALIQPVEHSYTVDTFNDLGESCGLEIMGPTVNEHDKATGTYLWHIDFNDTELQSLYDNLPDLQRWQFTNLLLLEQSPILWFYFQRKDSGRPIMSQGAINESFLDAVFTKVKSSRQNFLLQPSGSYTLSPKPVAFPATPPSMVFSRIYDSVDGTRTMRQIFQATATPQTYGNVFGCRTQLATTAFPFIVTSGRS